MLIFFAAFIAYLFLLHSGPGPVASSELAAAGATLGIPHAPGYPLAVLVTKVGTTLIPFGNLAYRANVTNALIFAGANVVFAKILIQLFRNRALAVLGTILFFGSHILLVSALAADTICLDILFLLLLINLSMRESPPVPLLGFIFGLSLTNHQTLLLLGPALAVRAFSTRKMTARRIGLALVFFLLGLTPYLFIPIRAQQNPVVELGDARTAHSFFRFLARKDYGSLTLAPKTHSSGGSSKVDRLAAAGNYFISGLRRDFTAWGLACIAIGSLWMLRFHPGRGVPLLLFLLVPFAVIGGLSGLGELKFGSFERAVFDRIAAIWYPVAAIWLVAGCHALAELAHQWKILGERTKNWAMLALCLPSVISVLQPVTAVRNYRNAFYIYDYLANAMRSIPPNGLLVFPGDIAYFGSLYLQHAASFRKDAPFLHQSELVGAWGREHLRERFPEAVPSNLGLPMPEFIEALAAKAKSNDHPLLVEPHSGNLQSIRIGNLDAKPHGLFLRANAGNISIERRRAALRFLVIRDDAESTRIGNAFLNEIFLYYAGAYATWGDEYGKEQRWTEAMPFYKQAFLHNEHFAVAYKIAWAYIGLNQEDSAEFWFRQALRLNPHFPNAYRDLIGLYRKHGHDLKARKLIEMAAEKNIPLR